MSLGAIVESLGTSVRESPGDIGRECVSGRHVVWRVCLGGRHDDVMALSGMGAKRGILPVEGLLETP